MLSDEEKKAIEILGEFKKNGFHLLNLKYESRVSTTKHIENSIEIILELIEKQSKEIEELKNGQIDFWISDKEIEERIRNKFVGKNKIKAKIEEINKEMLNEEKSLELFYRKKYCKEVLQSLLEKE